MRLHLVVPGLLWPRETAAQTARGLRLPALGTLIGRAGATAHAPLSFAAWLAHAFGIDTPDPPYAALRVAAAAIDPGDDWWICIDPIHLRFARDTLVVGSADELDLAADEGQALVAALNEHFPDLGEFIVTGNERWALRLKRPARIVTHPLEFVRGRQWHPFLPTGDDARDWIRTLNEMQMLLHAQPVNTTREARGRPTANSVWAWGAGKQPARLSAPAA